MCRVPIALKDIGLQQLKPIRLEDICVGQVVDVGFAIKVFTYGKTYDVAHWVKSKFHYQSRLLSFC